MTGTAALPYELKRVLVIQASRETVFRFFTDEARWAAWWGAGSTIDPRPGESRSHTDTPVARPSLPAGRG
jgi:uncharacterized protein YndB with AHSA1/START domain